MSQVSVRNVFLDGCIEWKIMLWFYQSFYQTVLLIWMFVEKKSQPFVHDDTFFTRWMNKKVIQNSMGFFESFVVRLNQTFFWTCVLSLRKCGIYVIIKKCNNKSLLWVWSKKIKWNITFMIVIINTQRASSWIFKNPTQRTDVTTAQTRDIIEIQ